MSSGVKVAVRVRPFNSREKERNAECIVKMNGNTTLLVRPSALRANPNAPPTAEDEKSFTFDHSYWSFDSDDPNFASQTTVFDDLGREVLQNAWEGFNCTIFAYGQTGSGKSYSMLGYGEDKGIIPLVCEEMFNRIGNTVSNEREQTVFKVEVSFMEIYNERVKDLLNPKNNKPGGLKVRNNPSTGPYVEDLSKLAVKSFQEIEMLMDEGSKARTVASTNMNATSSRSHAVFTIVFTQSKIDRVRGVAIDRVSKISLVDLAGSERAASTGATGVRLKEGANINKSLSTLGKVISALAENSSTTNPKKQVFVPYRDSVLTYLLKESLGGNSKTIMIAAISPADINFDETLSTLRYADSAKKIKTTATVNEDPQSKVIRELQTEVERLKQLLSAGGLGAADTAKLMGLTNDDDGGLVLSLNEKIEQYEKLMAELNKSWEEKLIDAEKIREERMSALKDMGVAIKVVSSIPHFINLNEDPLMSESLIYYLKEGTTRIGRSDADTPQDIILNGLNIAKEHCLIENNNSVVTITPITDDSRTHSSIFVNGFEISAPTVLQTGNRVILGNNHIFRFNHPEEAAKIARERERSADSHALAKKDQIIDYDFALNELASAQGNLAITKQIGDNREFQKQMKEQMKVLYGQMRSQLERDFDPETRERRENLALIAIRRWRSKVYRTRLLNRISHLILSLNEANAISDTFAKNIDLYLKLYSIYPQADQLNVVDEVEVDWRMTQIGVKVTKKDTGEVTMISVEEFIDRVYSMRELYQNDGKIENGIEDPFNFKFDGSNLIGVSHMYLKNILYLVDINRPIPILDTNGSLKGYLNVSVTTQVADLTDDDQPSLLSGDPYILIGKSMNITIQFNGINDLKDQYNDLYSKFIFNSDKHQTTHSKQLLDKITINIPNISDELINHFETDYIAFEIYGKKINQLEKSFDASEDLKRPMVESYEFMASLNILEPEQSKLFKPVHVLEDSDISNNAPSVTFRLKKEISTRQIVLKLIKSDATSQNQLVKIKQCKSVTVSHARSIGKREPPTNLAMLSAGAPNTPSTPSTPSNPSRSQATPSTPITPFNYNNGISTPQGTPSNSFYGSSNLLFQNAANTPTTSSNFAGKGGASSSSAGSSSSSSSSDEFELPVISASEDTIVVSWNNTDPSHLFNIKTRKGNKILFKISYVLSIVDFPSDVVISKDVSVKILSSELVQQPEGANSSLSNLLDKFKPHFKGESILHDSESSILHSGSVFNVHLTKSRHVEHQNKIGDMIDNHQENFVKLGYAMRMEKLRQELDLRQKLSVIREKQPESDESNNVDRIEAEEIVKKMSLMNNASNAKRATISRKKSTTSVIEVKINEIGSSALIKEDELRGYLKKKSTYKDEWKSRFFVWKKPYLYYSHSEKDIGQKYKKIDLTNTSIAPIPQEEVQHGFAVIQLRRVWLLQASSNEQREQWMQTLDPTRKISEIKDEELRSAKQQLELSSSQLDLTVENTSHIMELLTEQSKNYKNVAEMEIDALREETLQLRDTSMTVGVKLAECRDLIVALEQDKREKDERIAHYKQTIEANNTITSFQQRNLNTLKEDQKSKQSHIDQLSESVERSSRTIADISEQISQTNLLASTQKDELHNKSQEITQINSAYKSESTKLQEQTTQLNTLSGLLRTQMKAFENSQEMQKEQSANEQKKLVLLLGDLEGGLNKASQTITEQGNQNLILKKQLEEASKFKELNAQSEVNLNAMKDRLVSSENKLIDREFENTLLSDKLKLWEEEIKIKDSKLRSLENSVKEVRAEYENGMAFSREFANPDTNGKKNNRKSKMLSPEEQMENMRESSIAHQTHNAFLNLQLQRLESDMKQQEKVYYDTIQRLKKDLQTRNQQNIAFMKQQAGEEVTKKLEDVSYNYEQLKKKYFVSLVLATKLQHVMSGNICNVDAYDMYDQASNEHVLDVDAWPNWVAENIVKNNK
ncbi:kinesin-3 [Heterostelium album PN500]|uniref:Kinesin-3 n=1 Tax=Heterostelium pallidum (strain ATCC 26659 / Pp 5 / PN500) TaxID=670386 RepID=D3B143_HETP5|nr:kinesin-3 [Heterostelium album PN500]EFA85017.1 kinesin-3 [Heterostelium album PN500]|eukprot:XP_020437127.1 kinesin-3 [Heterostelium album PN500]